MKLKSNGSVKQFVGEIQQPGCTSDDFTDYWWQRASSPCSSWSVVELPLMRSLEQQLAFNLYWTNRILMQISSLSQWVQQQFLCYRSSYFDQPSWGFWLMIYFSDSAIQQIYCFCFQKSTNFCCYCLKNCVFLITGTRSFLWKWNGLKLPKLVWPLLVLKKWRIPTLLLPLSKPNISNSGLTCT